MKINKDKPKDWQGTHILKCRHCVGANSCKTYAMYCNVIKEMPDGRIKVKVYGERYWHTQGFKYRYVRPNAVLLYNNYFKD